MACLAKANGIPIEIESGYLPSALLLRLARRVRRIVSRGVHRGFDRSSPSPSHRTGGSRYRRPPRGGTGVDRRA
ncbi:MULTISPECIES: hypothetical protein [Streptomyces]|uniref:Uncharacterized protein n=1 Tax=Streptomyces flavovirens TaxID=52258 RepID=A0ABV8N3H1_9ACTN|nr:hypothetical protein [Streptomyces sp. MBT51]